MLIWKPDKPRLQPKTTENLLHELDPTPHTHTRSDTPVMMNLHHYPKNPSAPPSDHKVAFLPPDLTLFWTAPRITLTMSPLVLDETLSLAHLHSKVLQPFIERPLPFPKHERAPILTKNKISEVWEQLFALQTVSIRMVTEISSATHQTTPLWIVVVLIDHMVNALSVLQPRTAV